MTLGELFEEEEKKLLAQHREREAARQAEWDALTPEQQEEEVERRAAEMEALWDMNEDEDEDEDEDEE